MKIYKFFANWCKPCRELNEELKDIQVPLEPIDMDDADNLELIKKYKINKLPLILFVDDGGNTLKRLNGGSDGKITKEQIEETYNNLKVD